MAEQHSHMVINYVSNQLNFSGTITIGITNVLRWNNELETNHSGSEAKTLAMWELRDYGKGYAPIESINFFLSEDDPLRESLFKALHSVAKIGWQIRSGKMSSDNIVGTIL